MGGDFAAQAATMTAASTQTGNMNGMGKWYAIAQGISALTELGSGIAGIGAANRESKYIEEQGSILQAESERDARIKAREVEKFMAAQSHRFVSSGVTLQGSPIEVLNETRRLGQEEINAIIERGKAQSQLAKLKAANMRAGGRNSMLLSAGKIAGMGVEGYVMGRRLGIFGGKSESGSSSRGPVNWDAAGPFNFGGS